MDAAQVVEQEAAEHEHCQAEGDAEQQELGRGERAAGEGRRGDRVARQDQDQGHREDQRDPLQRDQQRQHGAEQGSGGDEPQVAVAPHRFGPRS